MMQADVTQSKAKQSGFEFCIFCAICRRSFSTVDVLDYYALYDFCPCLSHSVCVMELNLRQAQENELRVLSSIYTNLLKDLRSKREKRSRPPYFSLTITPLRSNSTVAQQTNDPTFDLIVRETSLYPNEYDELFFMNDLFSNERFIQFLEHQKFL